MRKPNLEKKIEKHLGKDSLEKLKREKIDLELADKYPTVFKKPKTPDYDNELIFPNRSYWGITANFLPEPGIFYLIEREITPDQAYQFLTRFNAKDTYKLIEHEISFEEAQNYGDGWLVDYLITFKENEIPKTKTKKLLERFRNDPFLLDKKSSSNMSHEISQIFCDECNIDFILDYDSQFSLLEMYIILRKVDLQAMNICDKFWASIPHNITSIPSKVANQYRNGSPEEIAESILLHITSDIINKYPSYFSLDTITKFYRIGITPEIPNFKNVIKKAYIIYNILKDEEFGNLTRKFRFLGVGNQSVVVRGENDFGDVTVWKIVDSSSEEMKIMDILTNAYKGQKRKNTIRLLEHNKNESYIGIEYINGISLENLVCLRKKLSPEETFRYGADIFYGLAELREAGVWYHRDIRPANIIMEANVLMKDNLIIDSKKPRAVIIDYGMATTDKDALSKGNRRYGSPEGFLANDLISLGQVMYFMATGTHLFMDSESKSRTFYKNADEIKDQRNRAYADITGKQLGIYLNKVDENIKEPKLRDIIRKCLAPIEDFPLLYKLFNTQFQLSFKF